jgi:hypothetical protein
VAERLFYSRIFGTQAADRSTNGVDKLLAAVEDKRIGVSLHAAAKAPAAHTFKQPMPGRGYGGNPDIRTSRPDKNPKDKELKDKEKHGKREKDKIRQNKKSRARGRELMVCTAAPIPITQPLTTCDIA